MDAATFDAGFFAGLAGHGGVGAVALFAVAANRMASDRRRRAGRGVWGVCGGFRRFLIVGATLVEPLIVSAALLDIARCIGGQTGDQPLSGIRVNRRRRSAGSDGLSGATLPQFYKFGLLIIVPLTALIAYGWRAAWCAA